MAKLTTLGSDKAALRRVAINESFLAAILGNPINPKGQGSKVTVKHHKDKVMSQLSRGTSG